MKLQTQGYPFSLSSELIALIESRICEFNATRQPDSDTVSAGWLTLNFRDPAYSPETGGYHPVEICVNAAGRILYITDFAFAGTGQCAELVKELDFDFSLGLFQQFGMEFPIHAGRELFRLWQSNFISYYQSGVYEVSIVPY